MNSFPLFRLPFLSITDVIKRFENMDLINFALVSKKSRNLAKLSRGIHRKIEAVEYIFCDDDVCNLTITFSKKNWDDVYWNLSTDKNIFYDERGKKDAFQFGAVKINNKRRRVKHQRFVVISHCAEQNLVGFNICKMICDIFIPKSLNLNFFRSNTEDISEYISSDLMNKVDYLTFLSYFNGTDKEFQLLREAVTPKKEFKFTFYNYDNQNHNTPKEWEHEKLNIVCAHWFTRADIDKVACRWLSIFDSNLKVEDLNYLLMKWMNNVDWKLEKASIKMENATLESVLDGIETMTFDDLGVENDLQNKKVTSFDYVKINRSEGRHFRRSDGTVASVHIQESGQEGIIYFYEWNETNLVFENDELVDLETDEDDDADSDDESYDGSDDDFEVLI